MKDLWQSVASGTRLREDEHAGVDILLLTSAAKQYQSTMDAVV
ncbi:MAG: hypothetical protein WA324_17720 [Bryobacteraceae bacterium]